MVSKIAIACVLFFVAVAFAQVHVTNPQDAFNKFMHKYEKFYGREEFQGRFANFKSNLNKIEELNTLSSGNAEFGITRFADLSPEEFQQRYLMNNISPEALRAILLKDGKEAADIVADIPESFDWRDKGAVTPVKNQGSCGSCWAFSATGSIEGVWKIKGNPLTVLSEQQLVDCDKTSHGCSGGWMNNAFNYVIKNKGIATEKTYPYHAVNQKCNDTSSAIEIGAKITSYDVISTDEKKHAEYLATKGPISVAINANPLQYYKNGILDLTASQCNPRALNHGVLMVGYGVTKDSKGNDLPYWIVKNSWGTSWGENGYFRIVRGTGCCGINTASSAAVV